VIDPELRFMFGHEIGDPRGVVIADS